MADTTESESRTPSKLSTTDKVADTQERKETTHQTQDVDEKGHVDSYRPDDRHRDRSPRRDRPRRKDAGFKWKEKRRDEEDDSQNRDGGLRRGYRDRDGRDRDNREQRGDRDDRDDRYQNSGRREGRRDRDEAPARRRSRSPKQHRDRAERDKEDRVKRPKADRSAPAPAPAMQQEMIIVYVNDRLGTKKAIPCLPTDRIKEFKVIVAGMIGRQPHEILLKRQGERPFKDVLTLQDYGVSNNVQLDLEVDTGD